MTTMMVVGWNRNCACNDGVQGAQTRSMDLLNEAFYRMESVNAYPSTWTTSLARISWLSFTRITAPCLSRAALASILHPATQTLSLSLSLRRFVSLGLPLKYSTLNYVIRSKYLIRSHKRTEQKNPKPPSRPNPQSSISRRRALPNCSVRFTPCHFRA